MLERSDDVEEPSLLSGQQIFHATAERGLRSTIRHIPRHSHPPRQLVPCPPLVHVRPSCFPRCWDTGLCSVCATCRTQKTDPVPRPWHRDLGCLVIGIFGVHTFYHAIWEVTVGKPPKVNHGVSANKIGGSMAQCGNILGAPNPAAVLGRWVGSIHGSLHWMLPVLVTNWAKNISLCLLQIILAFES